MTLPAVSTDATRSLAAACLVARALLPSMAAPAAAAALPGVLAPETVTRLSGRAEEVRPGVWEITVGEAVDAWVSANGPAEVTSYNLVKFKGSKIDSKLAVRRPIVASTGQMAREHHDLADLFDLTEKGQAVAQLKPDKQARTPQPSRHWRGSGPSLGLRL